MRPSYYQLNLGGTSIVKSNLCHVQLTVVAYVLAQMLWEERFPSKLKQVVYIEFVIGAFDQWWWLTNYLDIALEFG